MQFLVFRWSDSSTWSPWHIQPQTLSLCGQWNHYQRLLQCNLNQAKLPIRYYKPSALLLPVWHPVIASFAINLTIILCQWISPGVLQNTKSLFIWYLNSPLRGRLTSDPLLQLVCRSILHMQKDQTWTRLPITPSQIEKCIIHTTH